MLPTKQTLEFRWINERALAVICEGRIITELYLDYFMHLKCVVVAEDISDDLALDMLRNALWSAIVAGKKSNAPRDIQPNTPDIPEEKVLVMQRVEILGYLEHANIPVVFAAHQSARQAIDAAVAAVGIDSLAFHLVPHRSLYDFEQRLEFLVSAPHSFTAWKSVSRPSVSDLHIVPSYHPEMQGKKYVGLVNGTTDAYIRGTAVRSVYAPESQQTLCAESARSWDYLVHPYYAKSSAFTLSLSMLNVRSRSGMQELTELLSALLGRDDRYLAISGGFRPPLRCAHNRLAELGRRSPWPEADYTRRSGNIVRGSEESCVWEYRTLLAEGQLDKAYVPRWFYDEEWLEIYKEAEVRPGLY